MSALRSAAAAATGSSFTYRSPSSSSSTSSSGTKAAPPCRPSGGRLWRRLPTHGDVPGPRRYRQLKKYISISTQYHCNLPPSFLPSFLPSFNPLITDTQPFLPFRFAHRAISDFFYKPARQLHVKKLNVTSGAASVVIGNSLYMFGGYGGSGRLDDFYEYNFDSRRFRRIRCKGPCTPGPRENNGVVR